MAYCISKTLACLITTAAGCHAFVQPARQLGVQGSDSSTSLNAFTPPTMIIGGMIRKMREENAKKKAPMASDEEQIVEAPGLRVGLDAWKWPPVWPYEEDMFKRKDEIVVNQPAMNAMAGMLSGGMPQLPTSVDELPQDENKLDVLKYWGEEKAEVTTDLDADAVEKLKSHYAFYLRDGMAVLELGAAENSYLPDGVKLSRHVGVGASKPLMDSNPALTESLVVDLNEVIEENGVNSDDLRALGANTFDVVIMANTIDFLTAPREVFRSAWQLLKPGGRMMVAFSAKNAYAGKFTQAQTKMWQDFNDDQHMWVCGSFFQFSAGDGWEGLKGFDISPEGAKSMDDNSPLSGLMNRGKSNNMYVVQATKGIQDDSVDESDPEKSFSSKMWMLPTMEERDKMLIAPRLARAYEWAKSEDEKQAIANHVDALPAVYESLIKMDQFAFTFSMQAQLAADLVTDPDFEANDEQIIALKMGLGLRTPSEDFWVPVGTLTAGMIAEDKINLLAHIVPRFGSDDPAQEAALESFVTGLEPTFAVIRSKCPDMSEADVQLVGSELLAAEVLKPGRSTREEFASWLGALTGSELREFISRRNSFKETAVADMKVMQTERAAERERLEGRRKKMQEQVEEARKVRTMAFNERTGRMEEIRKK